MIAFMFGVPLSWSFWLAENQSGSDGMDAFDLVFGSLGAYSFVKAILLLGCCTIRVLGHF
jgi:hypothetical protein